MLEFYGRLRRNVADQGNPSAIIGRPSRGIVAAVSAVAALFALAGLGLTLWLDQGEALFVRLAADAWACCF